MSARSASRLVGVDVARCLALLGMMATHILPGDVNGQVTTMHVVASGRSSALFAVLAGVSLVLVAGTRLPLRGRTWWASFASTLVRAALIAGLGLTLGLFDAGIAVILVYYALLFVATTPFLALGTRALAWTTGAWWLLSPVVSHLLREKMPVSTYAVPAFDGLDQPGEMLRELLVTGYYPVLTWMTFLLLGVCVGRLDLRSRGVALWLAASGAIAMLAARFVSDLLLASNGVRADLEGTLGVIEFQTFDDQLAAGFYGTTPTASWWWLAVQSPHSGTSLDLLQVGGSALLVLGLALVAGPLVPRLLSVVFGAGAMTLTLYTLHVVVRSDGLWDGIETETYLGQVAVVLAIGAAFGWFGWRGPLEALVGTLSRWTRIAVLTAGSRASVRG